MKKLCLVILLCLFAPASFATELSVKCLDEKAKFSSCKLDVSDEQLIVSQGKNKTVISAHQVAFLKEKSYREETLTKDAMAIGAAGLFGAARNIFRKRAEHLNIIYLDTSNTRRSLFLEVPEKKAPVIKQLLETAMGRLFEVY